MTDIHPFLPSCFYSLIKLIILVFFFFCKYTICCLLRLFSNGILILISKVSQIRCTHFTEGRAVLD